MALVSTIGYSESNFTSLVLNWFCGYMMSTKCLMMQSVKKTLPCLTSEDTHGVTGRVIVNARKDKYLFQSRAWWQQEFLVNVIIVIHDINTGTVKQKCLAIFLRIWLLAIFSYTLVNTPKGIISASIQDGGYSSSYVFLKWVIKSSQLFCNSLFISAFVLLNLSASAK